MGMKTFIFKGLKTKYMTAGAGEPLIFLHNAAGDHTIWEGQIKYFMKTHRVYAVDLPGFGGSERPPSGLTLDFFTEFLDAFIMSEHLYGVTIAGVGTGAGIALNYGATHPSRARRLVLINPATFNTVLAGPSGILYWRISRKKAAHRLIKAASARITLPRFITEYWIKKQFKKGYDVPRGLMSHLVSLFTKKESMRVLFDVLENFEGFKKLDDPLSVDASPPSILVWGCENRVLPSWAGDDLGKIIKPHKKIFLEGCGHLLMIEKNGDLNEIIREFIAKKNEPAVL